MGLPTITSGKVVATAAGVLLLTSGAAVAHGMINSADIVNSSIKSVDIRNGGVKSADVLDSSLKASDLAPGSVGSSEVVDGSVSRADLGFDVPVVLAARVDSAGGLTRGIGATSATRTGVGEYEVTFNRSVLDCFPSVTATNDQHDEMASSLNGSTVSVDIEDPDEEGVQNDSPFFLTVVCPA